MVSFLRCGFVFLVTVLAAGCSLRSPAVPAAEETLTYGACNPSPCVKLLFHELGALSPEAPEAAATLIQEQVRRVVYAPIESAEGEYSKDRLVSEVEAQFDEYLEVSDAAPTAEWSLERVASVLYNDGKLVSVSIKNAGYLGGAHGFQDITLLVFDAQSGKRLEWGDVVSDGSKEVLLKASEAEFRRVREVPVGQSLADAGFDFSSTGSFQLPANFAISSRGLHLHYNAYEVAPYVMGPTDLIVPMEVFSGVARSETAALESVTGSKGALL